MALLGRATIEQVLVSPCSRLAAPGAAAVRASPRLAAPGAAAVRASPRRVWCQAAAQPCSEERQGHGQGKAEDWYQVLGVQRNATAKEVKAAYRQLVRRFHPDVVPVQDKEDCTSRFLEVHQAYAVLSDPQARAAFDLQLSLRRFQASGYTGRQGFAGVAAERQGTAFAGYTSTAQSYAAPYCYGYGYAGYSCAGQTGGDSQGFTSYASVSYPSVAGSSMQWKGKSWETDQCW